MPDFADDQLIGVPGRHGFGAVRVPQNLGDAAKPSNVKVKMPKLLTTKAAPPTFKGTHEGQIALPGADKAVAFLWSHSTWVVIPRADALKRMAATGEKLVSTPSAPKAATAPK